MTPANRYTLEWKRSALKEVRSLPVPVATRVVAAAEALAADPYPPGSRKLTGSSHTYRVRVGDYRVVYSVEAMRLVVEVVRVAHRSAVYRL